ncbi:MAG: ABC transporter ATP-binding protein, partial [Gammaproteobacteria bacterium]|nr:ABC transporter ATP-binding protein [Gammaproteobacteria bacterium]
MTHIHPTNLSLQDREFNVLLGATLSGKTTFLRLMAGLERPSSGEVWFSGQNVTSVSVQKRNIAMVYQDFINYPNFSVFENIAYPLKVAGKKPDQINQEVGKMAELLKLSEFLDRDVASLSGGQQQRIALARALVKKASLVLLDEPLANLDYKLREQLREELPRLFAASGSTVVYATSEPEEALMLGGHTAMLYEGKVMQYGKTTDIYRHPGNLESARIFSHPPINVTTVVKSSDMMAIPGIANWQCPESFSSRPNGEYLLGVRPHHLSLANLEGSDNHIPVSGTVQLAEIS